MNILKYFSVYTLKDKFYSNGMSAKKKLSQISVSDSEFK